MKNLNEKSTRQLPILFITPDVENGISNGGTVSMLIKWDAGIHNKFSIGNAECNDMNIVIQKSEQEHQYFRALLMEDMIRRENVLDKQQLIETVSIYFIRLMDTMFEFTRAKDLTDHLKTVAEKVCMHFQQTFEFIDEFFGSYINAERKAPSAYIEMTKAEILKKIKRLQSDHTSCSDNNSSLMDLVVSAITKSLSGYSVVSINSITYMRHLTDEMYRQSMPLPEQDIRDILYSMNFNEENFVMAEYERFTALTPDALSKNERIRILKKEQKMINQVIVRLNVYWTAAMPSLKEQVNGWLNEEIQFIESGTSALINKNGMAENCDKIQTSLSVAKLAVIIRLLVVDKVIINRQVASALRTVVKVFTTLQKDEISFGSLETKYHAPDKATINAVKNMLFKWINILGKL